MDKSKITMDNGKEYIIKNTKDQLLNNLDPGITDNSKGSFIEISDFTNNKETKMLISINHIVSIEPLEAKHHMTKLKIPAIK